MPNWGDVLVEINNEISKGQFALDNVRRKYLEIFHQYTGRNVIAYYSGFLQKTDPMTSIEDNDMNAFMQTVYGTQRDVGLDLILHTPGGSLATAISIVDYLKSFYGNNIRVFVPQMAMSAGTMIALASQEVVMGKESSIGPIDPQFGGVSCGGVIEEFKRAYNDIINNPNLYYLWNPILSKYTPTFIGECEKALKWSKDTVEKWLSDNMFMLTENKELIIKQIIDELSSHENNYYHGRQYHIDECRQLGIKVCALESLDKRIIGNCTDIQDCLLTIHHAYMQTFSQTNTLKIIENHLGRAMMINKSIKAGS